MEDKILAGHGSGGRLMNDMIDNLIRRTLGLESIQLDDSAVLDIVPGKVAFTTDTFVITPLLFPGGDIGKLAVNGTVNDLAVMGARPLYLSCGLILEEGLEMSLLKRVLESMRTAADYGGVRIVTGDTKVVGRGSADKIFINTAGIGLVEKGLQRRPIESGDKILISGYVGDHGVAVMAERNRFSFTKGLQSDCAPVNHIVRELLDEVPGGIKFMRDPTRGGVASVLNEIVKNQPFAAKLYEEDVPVRQEVRGVCDLLGIDPLYVANEGKLICIVPPSQAEAALNAMKRAAEGEEARMIGEITEEYPGKAYLETGLGGKRILPLLTEEQLPRIC